MVLLPGQARQVHWETVVSIAISNRQEAQCHHQSPTCVEQLALTLLDRVSGDADTFLCCLRGPMNLGKVSIIACCVVCNSGSRHAIV
jgi:hypothetical protein